MWRKYVKVGHGTLFRGPSGCWNLSVTVKRKGRSVALHTKNRDEAEMRRAEVVEGIRNEIVEEMSAIPLIGEWSRFEASPEAARLEGDAKEARFRAWRDFAAWMQTNHPDVTCASAIQRGMANEYMEFHLSSHTAATTNKAMFHLRGIVDAVDPGMAKGDNPFQGAGMLPLDSHSRRSLGRGEIARLLDAARDEGGDYYRLFLLAAYTGLRLGECCTLKWEDIDAGRGIMQFQPGKTRKYMNGRPVTVPLHWKLLKELLETPPERRTGAVLTELSEAYAGNRWCAKGAIARIFRAAGIETGVRLDGRTRVCPEASFHSLRHSFVSFAANAGVPLESLRAIVGHTTTAMTRHYYHADEDGLRMAVASVPEFDAWGDVVQRGDAPMFETRADRDEATAQRLREVEALFEEGFISERECNDACMRIACEA